MRERWEEIYELEIDVRIDAKSKLFTQENVDAIRSKMKEIFLGYKHPESFLQTVEGHLAGSRDYYSIEMELEGEDILISEEELKMNELKKFVKGLGFKHKSHRKQQQDDGEYGYMEGGVSGYYGGYDYEEIVLKLT